MWHNVTDKLSVQLSFACSSYVSSVVFQVELETAQQQISLLTQQKELLRERLENMSDYPGLKRERAELQGQLRLLKTQLEEAQEENRLLHAGEGRLLLPFSEESSYSFYHTRLRESGFYVCNNVRLIHHYYCC